MNRSVNRIDFDGGSHVETGLFEPEAKPSSPSE